MASEINNLILVPLEVEEPLEDIIIEECSCAVFECKLSDNSQKCNSYRWYKNGKCIKPKPSLQMSSDGIWYRLEIMSANVEDQGVYYILMENDNHKAFSYSNLYVRPIRDSFSNNNEVLYMNPSTNNLLVEKHLLHTRVLVRGIIELEAKFNVDVEVYQWYIGDKRILQNERTIILNDKRTTTLSTLCARETDTGIYHIVARTKYGVTSSFATVVVVDTDQIVFNNCEVVPRIIDPLIDDTETNEGEEIRLICKAFIDSNTLIKWSKKGKCFNDDIKNSNDIVQEIYNNEYISLRILKPSILDTGEYTVNLNNEITGLSDSSTCFLTVNKSPKSFITPVKLKKPLVSTMVGFGSSVLFTCSFDLKDPRYYFVVWYIGHYRVERTNHRFSVFSRGGDLFLFVKLIEPGMAGEITCELHVSLPNRKSILINKTAARLTIVPNFVLAEEKRLHIFPPMLSIYNTASSITVPIRNEKRNENGVHKNGSTSANGISLEHNEMDSIFQMTCCGLEDNCFYIDAWSKSDLIQHLTICEKLQNTKDTKYEDRFTKSLIIEWNCHNEINKKWYIIEFSQLNGDFVKAGVSSVPIFELIDPPIEQLMSFRIKIVDPFSNSSETHVSISPATRELILSKKDIEIKPMEEFNTQYTKTGDLIGCGAFGSVVLVKDQNDDFYAAKVLKTRTQKKRETALREFQIMKNLKHSKLVELIDTFVAKEAFVLVMDYLWGGELFDRIVEEEHIKEVDVVPYVKQICEALQYLHNLKIAHLDLKPENIICLSPNSRQVKIIDFGLARVLDDGHETRAIYGTKDYVAPEVLNFEQLTLACDMWSLGVVTYMLLSGVMPFSGETWVQRSANITMANYNYNESAFIEISDLAKDFVDHLLVLQPEKRMSSSVALNHQWILEGPPRGAKAGHMKQARENLKTYLANYRARWQRAGNVMIAAHRLRTHAASQRISTLNTGQELH